MVEFNTSPTYHPLDRAEEFMSEEDVQIEKPIFPISQLGATVPEHDPVFKNMVQTVQANIRRGVGQMQLMLQTPAESAIGGRPKAYGKEIREAIKEVIKANEVQIKGIEMPTQSVNNLSGFDPQQRVFDEEKRLRNIKEVEDALRFAADIGGGGGVDLVSFEFPRPINDARWQKKDKYGNFLNEGETSLNGCVDTRTGQVMMFRTSDVLFLNRKKDNFEKEKEIYDEKGNLKKPERWTWQDFQKWSKKGNDETIKEFQKTHGRRPEPEELFYWSQFQQQMDQQKGQIAYYNDFLDNVNKKIERIGLEIKDAKRDNDKKSLEVAEREYRLALEQKEHYEESISSSNQHIEEIKYRRENILSMQEYGVQKSEDGYARLGISAMRETRKPNVKQNLYVGPEIGWPTQFGGHPDEFVDLIMNARKRMVDLITKPQIKDPTRPGAPEIQNEFYDPRYSKKQAEELAKKHIKGMFDTGHLGMWWEHWKKDSKKSEEENFKDFENWYLKKVDRMIEHDVIGGVQAVDSGSAAHGHLPPGQGIFGDVIKEAAIKLKKSGWKGYIVSEGHEEEKFGEGRILYKTWEHLGGYPGRPSYAPNFPGQSWSQMQHSYMGRTYSPLYMFGSYAPSNEFKLWSEVPLE
jgi:hypothetical protein